jgi:SAM-dependent methyltransferase
MQLKEKIKGKILSKLIYLLRPQNEYKKFLIWQLFSLLPESEKDWITRISIEKIKAANPLKEVLGVYLNEIAGLIIPEERFLIPSFENGLGPETDRFSYQQKYIDFPIKDGDRVLDIGSGAYPFPLATHLTDLFEGETTHRAEPLVRDHREFSLCNIEALPYGDKEFDFVYCSHVMEHVPDPAKACEEIMRVGKRGYIETPTRTSDIMFNFIALKNHHRWHIVLAQNTLIFCEWADKERRDTGCTDLFKMFHSKYKNPFQTLVTDNRDLFVNMLQWHDYFFYYIFNKNGDLIVTNKE